MQRMSTISKILSSIACVLLTFSINAQDIEVKNGSFEGMPQQGQNDRDLNIRGWVDCGINNFPTASPPDLHQSSTDSLSYWENESRRAHGKTYLGMVVRDNESWESVSQRLESPLLAGQCYNVSIHLARSRTYKSASSSSRTILQNFTEPTVLRIWGSRGYCDASSQLLAESEPIVNTEWEKFTFRLEPDANYQYITLEAFYETPLLVPYNGHILLDDMSHFEKVNCNEEIIAEQVPKPTAPAHKKKKKKKKPPVVKNAPPKIDTIVAVKKEVPEETILGLDRKKLKKNQKIGIEQLYFDADTSSIDVNSYEVLNEIYDFLNLNDDIKVEIGGHTNNVPNHDYCDKLSTDRAQAVANYLIGKGLGKNRISYKGYGKRKPKVPNTNEDNKRKNQRVEIRIISIG